MILIDWNFLNDFRFLAFKLFRRKSYIIVFKFERNFKTNKYKNTETKITASQVYFSHKNLHLILVWKSVDWLGLASLYNGISTFVGYLMPNLFS